MRFPLRPGDLVAPIRSWISTRERRTWTSSSRLYVAIGPVPAGNVATINRDWQAALSDLPGVRWARINTALGRVVVDYDPAVANPGEIRDRIATLDGLRGFREVDEPVEHPADDEPLARRLIEISADSIGLALGLALRAARVQPSAAQIDIAALLSALDGVPWLREQLERLIGSSGTDLALGVASALDSALLQGAAGPVVDIIHRYLGVRELRARKALWVALEDELGGAPDKHAGTARPPGARPGGAPRGPVEEYAEKAVPAALGAFGLGLAASGSIATASAGLFGGIPRPARLGREAFGSHLGWRLASWGILVRDRKALRRLDTIDAVVLARGAAEVATDAEMAAIKNAAGRAQLSLELSDDEQALARVRALQAERRAVCLIALGAIDGLAEADVSVALIDAGSATPWAAHILCPKRNPSEIATILAAAGAARQASRQGVQLSLIDSATSVALSLNRMSPDNTRRVMTIANTAALIAIANGVRLAHGVVPPAPRAADPVPWHALEPDVVLDRLAASADGLRTDQAASRMPPAEAPPAKAAVFARLVGDELVNPLAPILAAGAGLSAMVGSIADTALIGAVVGINALMGGAQRYRIQAALDGLDHREGQRVRARRDGRVVELDAREVVVGDVLELEAGDVVPADCRLLVAEDLEVDESALTGESLPVGKSAASSYARELAERTSMLYESSSVAAGKAVAVVVATGAQTEARRAIGEGAEPQRASGVEARLDSLTRLTAPAAALSGLVVTASGLLRGQPARDVVGAGVSLAVAAVPEGLPVLATVAQLSAAGRLADRGALARNPRAVEALGRVDVLCADKTGTLTEGRIRLRTVSDGASDRGVEDLDEELDKIVATGLRASPDPDARITHITDRAMLDGADRAVVDSAHGHGHWERVRELPFEPGRGFHAVLGRNSAGQVLSVKGAPEIILPRCEAWRRRGENQPMDDAMRERLLERADAMAARGLRVLAVAERHASGRESLDDARVERLWFRGFLGFADPVRPSARRAVADLRAAGVEIVMVTGDHPATACNIAAELELPHTDHAITGAQLEEMDDDALDAVVRTTSVFARVTPRQKVRIVKALQRAGSVVGMTGDGANDAPAIRLADVGIALGEGATAAARAAADVVVTDERIETIVDAVLEGRGLWSSVRDAVAILVGGNLGEIAFTLVGSLIGGDSPLNTRQLLLVNMLTDAVPALAIALRPPARVSPEQLLREGPEASLGESLTRDIIWRGVVTAGAATGAWLAARATGGPAGARSVGLIALTATQLTQTLIVGRQSRLVVLSSLGSLAALLAAVETPGVSQFFGCRPLGPVGLAQAATATALATGAAVLLPRAARRFGSSEQFARLARYVPGDWLQRAAEVVTHP